MKFFTCLIITVTLLTNSLKAEDAFNASQKEALGKAIDDHIMKNPQVLVSALQQFEEDKTKEQLAKSKAYIRLNQDKLMNSPNDFVAGNPKAKVTMVVFMDPACPHCQSFYKVIEQALDTKTSGLSNLKIVFKDIPIFGESSKNAVSGMLAAKEQKKYAEFHKAMYQQDGDLTPEDVIKIAGEMGLDKMQFAKDFTSEKVKSTIALNRQIAQDLGIHGTPTIILGDTIIPGEISFDTLKEAVVALSKV